jgi:hypothetical protein
MELMQAHNQWKSRPADERFLSLTELDTFCLEQRRLSASKVVSSRALTAMPVGDTHDALALSGPQGNPVALSHWSFGQLATRAGAPAGYLRTIPSEIAADCINYGLKHSRDVEEIGILLTKSPDTVTARAVTGPNYGRIWNSTISSALVKHFGDGLTGRFRIPGEFGKQVPITADTTTLYASDRDLWVFLADEQNRIELPHRRNGRTGSLARGFYVSNSEVGAGKFVWGQFLFDFMCCNHIIWGVEEFQEISIRHTKGAPDRYIEQIQPAIRAMTNASTVGITDVLKSAQRQRLDDVDTFLANRFTASQAKAISAAHMADEGRPIETLWDAVTGITAYARELEHADTRVGLEREAGKILKLANTKQLTFA